MGCRENGEDGSRAHMSEALPQVVLVRHGETAWTISRQHTGRTEIPLTEQGEREAQALRARLKSMSFTEVLTSPLQRARKTADLAGFSASAQSDPDLMEWNYGTYEGRRTSDIRAERPRWRLFEDGCPGGETLLEVSARGSCHCSSSCAPGRRTGLRPSGRRPVSLVCHRPISGDVAGPGAAHRL